MGVCGPVLSGIYDVGPPQHQRQEFQASPVELDCAKRRFSVRLRFPPRNGLDGIERAILKQGFEMDEELPAEGVIPR
jgi:hypothetical protein